MYNCIIIYNGEQTVIFLNWKISNVFSNVSKWPYEIRDFWFKKWNDGKGEGEGAGLLIFLSQSK